MTTSQSKYPNRDAVRRCLDIYLDAIRPFVVRQLRRKRGSNLQDAIYNSLNENQANNFRTNLSKHENNVEAALDFGMLRTILTDYANWNELFRDTFRTSRTTRSAIHFITEIRNSEDAHPGVEDTDEITALTLMHHVVDVLTNVNDTVALLLAQKERDNALDRCVEIRRGVIVGGKVDERLRKVKEMEHAAAAAIRQAQERETVVEGRAAIMNLGEAVGGIEKIAAEHEAAVAEHEAAVAEHEAAVAEHEAAVAEHEAAIAELEAAIILLDTAKDDHEMDAATKLIRRAEEWEAAANERETAANDREVAANLREEAANLHEATAKDYLDALEQQGVTAAEAIERAKAHGEATIEAIRQAQEREAAAKETLRRAEEREADTDNRESEADKREAEADKRETEADERRSTIPARPTLDKVPERWGEVTNSLRHTKGQKHFLGPLLKDCIVNNIRVSDDGSKLVLPFKSIVIGRMLVEELTYPPSKDKVLSTIAQVFGDRYGIEVIRN